MCVILADNVRTTVYVTEHFFMFWLFLSLYSCDCTTAQSLVGISYKLNVIIGNMKS